MAVKQLIFAVLVLLAFCSVFVKAQLHSGYVVKGNVNCIDCSSGSDLSDIMDPYQASSSYTFPDVEDYDESDLSDTESEPEPTTFMPDEDDVPDVSTDVPPVPIVNPSGIASRLTGLLDHINVMFGGGHIMPMLGNAEINLGEEFDDFRYDRDNPFLMKGIQVLIKCDKIKKLSMTYTEKHGSFQTELPSDGPESGKPSNCAAKIMGGPYHLYVKAVNSLVPVSETRETHYFAASKPLNYYRNCPENGKCGGKDMGFGSSKTVDLPLPKEWGLPPTSYYIPYVPIIGIP